MMVAQSMDSHNIEGREGQAKDLAKSNLAHWQLNSQESLTWVDRVIPVGTYCEPLQVQGIYLLF